MNIKKFNWRLYFALLISTFIPTIYTTVRIYFIGGLPDTYSFSIAGQLGWVNLIYEIIEEAIILPLFFFIGQVIHNKSELSKRIKSGLIFSAVIYSIISILVILFVDPLLNFMKVSSDIASKSAFYIRLESIGNVFSLLVSFLMVVFTTIGKEKHLYFLLVVKMFFSIFFDIFFVSTLSCSINLGINGIGLSNIISNIILLIISIFLLQKEKIKLFNNEKVDFSWIKNLAKIGGISGLESFVRNIFYMLMICRMVNMVGEQGTYWVANSFIWGWLLKPIAALGELIKKEISSENKAIKENTKTYFIVTVIICCIWFISIPLWKPFMQNILRFNDVDKLFSLVIILIGFYVAYAFQNIFDMTFYALGKTEYMLAESIVTNILYYGIFYVLFRLGIFVPTLNGIAIMFGAGCAFDAIVSFIAYKVLLRKMHLSNVFIN